MISQALRLFAVAKAGTAAKQAVRRACVQAAVIAAASLLILAGAVFALVCAYLALTTMFTPVEAAGAMAAGLILAGLIVLALRSMIVQLSAGKKAFTPQDAAESVQRGAADVTRAVGPAQIIALSLLAGLAAGRSLGKS